jgi:23S rRNA (adenine2503-C2)-methyltransferase
MSNSDHIKPTLAGLGPIELGQAFAALGVPEKAQRMRVAQIWNWIYARGAQSFDEMTTLSKELRGQLADAYSLERPQIVTEQVSIDGTRKWLARLEADKPGEQGPLIETVYIHARNFMYFKPGRLHAHLLVLPYGHAETGA